MHSSKHMHCKVDGIEALRAGGTPRERRQEVGGGVKMGLGEPRGGGT